MQDVLHAPTVYGPEHAIGEATYVLFMIDQDVNTGNGPRVQLLHYFQPNLVGVSEALSVQGNARNATTAAGAAYLTPSPPEGDGPHRYTILLYPQPEGFTVPEAYASFSPPADVNARYPFQHVGIRRSSWLGGADCGQLVPRPEPHVQWNQQCINEPCFVHGHRLRLFKQRLGAAATTSTFSGSAASSSASASASASSTPNSAAVLMETRSVMKELVIGLVAGVAAAGLWMM